MVAGVPWLIGGSADLATSCLTTCNGWDGVELRVVGVGGVEPGIYCSYELLMLCYGCTSRSAGEKQIEFIDVHGFFNQQILLLYLYKSMN